jgi:hypothetical protein
MIIKLVLSMRYFDSDGRRMPQCRRADMGTLHKGIYRIVLERQTTGGSLAIRTSERNFIRKLYDDVFSIIQTSRLMVPGESGGTGIECPHVSNRRVGKISISGNKGSVVAGI